MTLRIGVIGVGAVGYHHLRILRELEGVDVVGFREIRPDRARQVSARLGVPALSSLEALLEAADAAVVAVPTEAHEEVALAAVHRGVHILVEKPIAPSLAAADRILEAARRESVLVQIGHVERFNAAVLAAGEHLGRPLFIESHRLASFEPRGIDVPVVLDLMIHDVDLVLSLMGCPVREVAAVGVPVLTSSVDIANARLTFENGGVANLTASRVSVERKRKIRIFQPSGYLSLDLAAGRGEFLRLKAAGTDSRPRGVDGAREASMAGLVERIPLGGARVEPLRKELESFRDAVAGRAPPAVSGEEGRAALAVTLSIVDHIERHVADQDPP